MQESLALKIQALYNEGFTDGLLTHFVSCVVLDWNGKYYKQYRSIGLESLRYLNDWGSELLYVKKRCFLDKG